MTPGEQHKDYLLTLSDNQKWRIIVVSGGLLSWVDEAARMMELDSDALGVSSRVICSFITKKRVPVEHPDVRLALVPFESFEDEIVVMQMLLYPVYRESMQSGWLPFHAALIERAGQGVLFAGRSGAGKSICCRRLPDHRNVLCDDEVLIVLDETGSYRAHPFPAWSDYLLRKSNKTWNVRKSLPIAGVFFIRQDDADEGCALGAGEAVALLSHSSEQLCRRFLRRSQDEFTRMFRKSMHENACSMAGKIAVFRLGVSLEGRFWKKIERMLGGRLR